MSYKVRIENGDFWKENDEDIIFPDMSSVNVAINEFLSDANETGLNYSRDEIEVIEQTQILHTQDYPNLHYLKQNGWIYLCDGHGDCRLTGGIWLYKGNKDEAQIMQQARWKIIKAHSNSYYSQPWI